MNRQTAEFDELEKFGYLLYPHWLRDGFETGKTLKYKHRGVYVESLSEFHKHFNEHSEFHYIREVGELRVLGEEKPIWPCEPERTDHFRVPSPSFNGLLINEHTFPLADPKSQHYDRLCTDFIFSFSIDNYKKRFQMLPAEVQKQPKCKKLFELFELVDQTHLEMITANQLR